MKYPLVEGYCLMVGGSLDDLAKHLHITRRTLNNKLYGRTEFTMSEVQGTAEYCGRSMDEIFLQPRVTRKAQ